MIRLIIVSDSFSHFKDAILEYEKRLKDIEIFKIKPENSTDVKNIVKKETGKIKGYIEKNKGYTIYLDVLGESLDTNRFHDLIEKTYQNNSKINIIIGGAYGIDLNAMGNIIDMKISLSKMTFPHSLALLMILEQIYRIDSIKKNTGYHH
ncbi:MAG: 23S rRNA (pseudouridine(1915)-N(3))-methyltransferase RlmH [Candidatus Gracilibacteria bacterium]|nr:23S rRNA (pseudouridine(1915)-N(3))-methyltransferase RlmH [Candidatus Gracilibacteria bacterium]